MSGRTWNLHHQYGRHSLNKTFKSWKKYKKRAVGMISGLRGENYEDKCKELKLDTLQLRWDKQNLQEMYKIMTGTGELNPENLFKKPKIRTGAVTRSADDPHHLPTPRTRLEIRKNFFTVRIVEKWNALPSVAEPVHF